MYELDLEKSEKPESKLPTSLGTQKKQGSSRRTVYFCFSDYAKSLCVDHNKLWKILKEMGIPDHLTCLLRNLYAGQEATVRTRHGTMDWFQIGKGVHQGCILLPCLFNWAFLIAQLVKNPPAMQETHLIPGTGRSAGERDRLPTPVFLGFPCSSAGKEFACNVRDLALIPGLGRSPGEGKGYSLQSCSLENSMNCTVRGVAYLTSVRSTLCKMLGWMNHKLESRLLGEISISSDMKMTPPLRQKAKSNKRAS